MKRLGNAEMGVSILLFELLAVEVEFVFELEEVLGATADSRFIACGFVLIGGGGRAKGFGGP